MNIKIFDKMGVDKYTEKKFDSLESLQLFLQKNNLYVLHWDEKYLWTLKKIFFNDVNLENSSYKHTSLEDYYILDEGDYELYNKGEKCKLP
jgi:hypothetical protein